MYRHAPSWSDHVLQLSLSHRQVGATSGEGTTVRKGKMKTQSTVIKPFGNCASILLAVAFLSFSAHGAPLVLDQSVTPPNPPCCQFGVNASFPLDSGQTFTVGVGGLLSRAQVTNMTRADWEKTLGAPAMQIFATLQPTDLVTRATTFKANPRIKRVVFICTPHLGSKMASAGIGELAIKLISLPVDLVTTIESEVPEATLRKINNGRLPNSVSNLAPNAPYLAVLNRESIQAPYHSIIGNRGKPGPLADSSDGVVPYWSSHLDGAKSECIVPGPHGSCELPQTIAELDRILRLHLGISSASKASVAQAAR